MTLSQTLNDNEPTRNSCAPRLHLLGPRFVMATSSDIPADSSSGKAALQGRPAVSLATSTATSTTG